MGWRVRVQSKEFEAGSQRESGHRAHIRAAEREGFAPQVRNFVRQAERERGREKGRGGRA